MKATRFASTWLVLALALTSCSSGSLSDRDSRLEQVRLQAEAKRRELRTVAGNYEGRSEQSTGATHEIFLRLEIKDIPTQVEGLSEPVMIPALSGYIRFYLGTETEFVVFAIDKAGFDISQNKIELAASHPEYKDLLITLSTKEPEVTGPWTAPSTSGSGIFYLKRVIKE